jgi:Sulfotransferase domain
MADRPLVNFLIAGVQKAGTTALYDYLAEMGDVALPKMKELHFFDDEARDWAAPDYGAYHAHFADSAGRPRGEATPIYLYWPGALERIAHYNPAMKLIVLLRDPVARAWSHWRMETARGAETQPFGWCIRQGRQRLFDARPWGHHREFSYVERGFYGEQLEHALGLFPREQLLILRAEDLRADPGPELGKVRAFLDLPPATTPAPREAHVGDGSPDGLADEDRTYLRRVYAADDERLKRLIDFGFD